MPSKDKKLKSLLHLSNYYLSTTSQLHIVANTHIIRIKHFKDITQLFDTSHAIMQIQLVNCITT